MAELKKYMTLVITGLVTFAATIVLIIMLWIASSKVAKLTDDLNSTESNKKDISSFQWKLTTMNGELAKTNTRKAEVYFDRLMGEIHKTYPPPPLREMEPADCMIFLTRVCDVMYLRLKDNNVTFPEGANKFTFDEYLGAGTLPPEDAIPHIIKHSYIVDELVSIIANSGLTELHSINRLGDDIKMHQKRYYGYLEYSMKVSGSYPAVQRFLNSLNTEAQYFFVVRNLSLIEAEDLAQGISREKIDQRGAAPTREQPGFDPLRETRKKKKKERLRTRSPKTAGKSLSKAERIVFEDLAKVTLEFTVDYIEFAEDKKGKKKKKFKL